MPAFCHRHPEGAVVPPFCRSKKQVNDRIALVKSFHHGRLKFTNGLPLPMNATSQLFSRGYDLDLSERSFGEPRRSDDISDHPAALQERFSSDGYLFVPGFFNRKAIIEIRHEMTRL